MGSELESLKSTLRSLVVSCPTSVDAAALRRDYRNMMGEHIPIGKYGYRDLVQFLKERCSDSFYLQGPAANPTVTLIVPKTLQHIDKFVRKQKIPSTAKFKGKRYSIQAVASPSPMKYVTQSKPIENWRAPQKHATNKENDSCNNIVSQQTNNDVVNQMAKLTVDSKANGHRKENVVESNHPVEPDNSRKPTSVQKFLSKRLPLLASTIESYSKSDEEPSSTSHQHRDDDSGRLTASSGGSSGRRRLLDEVRVEVEALLADYPSGVWSTDLLRLYRERFHRELPFERLGYTSVVSCARVLHDVARVERPELTGDWLIVPVWSPPCPRAAPRAPRAPAPAPAAAVDADDALPGIDFDTSVFPADCVHCVESVPRLALAAAAGDMLRLVVSEVYSPSHFWLQLLGADHRDALDNLMDDMTEYYSRGAGRERVLARGAVRAGHHCAAVFEGDWHRALIVKVIDDDFVKVRHIDYGTVARVASAALKPLLRDYCELPAQAWRGRLAGVRPAAALTWPHAASAALLARVRDRPLVGNVLAVDHQERILELFLVDTSTEEDACINEELVVGGLAARRPDSALQTSEAYLFPTFVALEQGDTPNYGEILQYLRRGIALEYVPDYTRHVPRAPQSRLPIDYLLAASRRRAASPDTAAPPPPATLHAAPAPHATTTPSTVYAHATTTQSSNYAHANTIQPTSYAPSNCTHSPAGSRHGPTGSHAAAVPPVTPSVHPAPPPPTRAVLRPAHSQYFPVYPACPPAACYPPLRPRPPPPPPHSSSTDSSSSDAAEAPELVVLPALECEVYRALSVADRTTAERHMLGALARAAAPAPARRAPAPCVALRALDCRVYRTLTQVDKDMAQRHMLALLARALPPPPPSALNPEAKEFRACAETQTNFGDPRAPPAPPAHASLSSLYVARTIRPPPGFEHL